MCKAKGKKSESLWECEKCGVALHMPECSKMRVEKLRRVKCEYFSSVNECVLISVQQIFCLGAHYTQKGESVACAHTIGETTRGMDGPHADAANGLK